MVVLGGVLLLHVRLMRPCAQVAERVKAALVGARCGQRRKRRRVWIGSAIVKARLLSHSSTASIAASEDAFEIVAFTS